MEYTKEQLDKIHKIEIEILSEINRLCEENGIEWFADGGTTLGAIRHNGFIPWDDDIDIGMIREDYDKFLEVAREQLKKGYTLQHFVTDKNTPSYFAKVRKDGTKFAEFSNMNLKIHHGVFVDIMPFDKAPENSVERKRYYKKVKMLLELYKAKTMWRTSRPATYSIKSFLKTCIRCILHVMLLVVPKRTIYNKLEKQIRKYNNTDTKLICSVGPPPYECLADDVFPTKKHIFDGIEVNIPKDSHKVLTIQYGDYMKLPPVEKRVGHSPYKLEL